MGIAKNLMDLANMHMDLAKSHGKMEQDVLEAACEEGPFQEPPRGNEENIPVKVSPALKYLKNPPVESSALKSAASSDSDL